ncbi:NAD-glutamate dehydrogenase GdhB [soil metagenome]
MSTLGTVEPHDVAVEGLCERIAKIGAGRDNGDPRVFAEFSRRYLNRVPLEYLTGTPPDEIAAQVLSVYDYTSSHNANDMDVRVFNPTKSEHGYDPGGAVVEVVCPDMAFLIDSVTNEIQGRGYTIERVFHPVLGIQRGPDGTISAILPTRTAPNRESLQHYELGRRLTDEEIDKLTKQLGTVLLDVRRAVIDFEPMQGAIFRMIKAVKESTARYDQTEVSEAVAYLEWLLDDNFVFLGYREYQIIDTPEGRAIVTMPESGLGILTDSGQSGFAKPVLLDDLHPELRTRYESGHLVVITKTNGLSRVHRRSKLDYVGVRRVGPDGQVNGELRMLGLFTSKAYMAPVSQIPILRSKLTQILEAEDTMEGSHYYKELVQLFESFPKDELFSTPTEDIRRSMVGLVELQEREQVRLFLRRDLLQRSVSLLVVMPRDRFNAAIRRKLQDLFMERFGGSSVDYRLALGETDTARLHFTVWIADNQIPNVDPRELEDDVLTITKTWDEKITELASARLGTERAEALADRWAAEFPEYYRNSVEPELVVGDMVKLQELADNSGGPVVGLQNEPGGSQPVTRLAVYKSDGKMMLSEVMPTLEALGLQVVEEVPTRLLSNEDYVIHDFGVVDAEGRQINLGACGDRLVETVGAVLHGDTESDSINRLILTTELTYHQLGILRAYRTYWRRVRLVFAAEYVNDALVAHPAIARDLVELFEQRFDPERRGQGAAAAEAEIVARIVSGLDAVGSLDEDRILRGLLGLIQATVRTNAYRPDRESLSFKFRSAEVPGMPKPAPLFEIFMFHPDVEGLHLRGGRVARGGIRWSTRREDYRTEVLGLMKAQMTKNVVIVPTGSKGGFVLRRTPSDPAKTGEAVLSAYTSFIGGLLDVTDNLVEGRVVHPPNVVIHDENDPYLVVAADKGTATFSDTANAIAARSGYWLGDAFASGGSAGYDHKALGITARGAWESVKWHFREIGIDTQTEPISVVGIGDMSGDVFGNGMLLSPTIRLVAAFDHRDIFIDPDPDPAVSFAERRRLFELPRSSWRDYDASLISAGGGVYSRSAKRVELSPLAMSALGLHDPAQLTPDEVIGAILAAPVDLLWNGGIGTYVKAMDESHEQVGDRVNDALRIDAAKLRCRVVGEGGNLGFTQLGRIEYAMGGGRINTDFIDNSAGVHCSDREVNLKIMLGLAEERGDLDRDGRDRLVSEVVDEVVAKILYDNFLQAQILGQEQAISGTRTEAYEDLMAMLEGDGSLDRRIERLPSSEDMIERARDGIGLTSPELAVLLAYAKRNLRHYVLESDLPDEPVFDHKLRHYFPAAVVERFGDLIDRHPLRRELLAMILANEVVNSQGITFVSRLMADAGIRPERVVRAYEIAREVTDAPERWAEVEALIGSISAEAERQLLSGIDGLVEAVTRWYLRNPSSEPLERIIEPTRAAFRELATTMHTLAPAEVRQQSDAEVEAWCHLGVPEDVARRQVHVDELFHAPDIIDVAHRTGHSLASVARIFLAVGPIFEIDWLEAQLERMPATTRWQRAAGQAVAGDLVELRRELAERVIGEAGEAPPETALEGYLASRGPALSSLNRIMRALSVDGVDDISGLVVAIRQIKSLAE